MLRISWVFWTPLARPATENQACEKGVGNPTDLDKFVTTDDLTIEAQLFIET